MALAAGSRLGPYEILTLIGAGAMGEVYKAHDVTLNRYVALKILPEAYALAPDRLARFKREAQILASLNHANIAAIYGFEDSSAIHALVLELVDGPTLADRIARGALPLEEALPIAKQIAEALEAAHEQGIIHRDLKPENIKLRADHTVKVLDFGLAKALDPAVVPGATMSPTPSVHSTQTGVILGSAAYMSPEQAVAEPLDKRTDLWSLGTVLYEMLTGRRAFGGESLSRVLAAVLDSEPEWTRLPANTRTSIRKLIRRCLEKDRKHRIADATDVRFEIEDALQSPAADETRRAAGHRSLVIAAAVAAFTTLVTGSLLWRFVRTEPTAPVYTSLDAPPGFVLGEDDALVALPTRTPLVFSADGRALIVQAARDNTPQLFIRPLDSPESKPITGTDNARVPFVSPDGKWIGFSNDTELRKIPFGGGPPTTICSSPGGLGPLGAAWGPGDVIIFGDPGSGRIMRVSAGGGTPAPVTPRPAVRHLHTAPFFLPDGTRFLFSDVSVLDATAGQVMVQTLDGGEPQPVVAGTDARVLASGQLVFMRLGTLMMAGFDVAHARIIGTPVAVMSGVMQSGLRSRAGANNTGAGMFTVSSQGHLAAIRGPVTGGEGSRMIWVTRDGRSVSAEPATGVPDSANRLYLRVSPDQSKALVSVITPLHIERWIADWTRNLWTRCDNCGHDSLLPAIWSPDGRRVLFSENDTLIAHALDGSTPDRVLVRETDRLLSPANWLRDGRILYEARLGRAGAGTVEIKLLQDGAHEGQVIVPAGEGLAADASPDGRWLAYTSLGPGGGNVSVQALQGPPVRVVLSPGGRGGTDPVWSADGHTVYYLSIPTAGSTGTTVFAADLKIDGEHVTAGKPVELFHLAHRQPCSPRCNDVAAGPRFLLKDRVGIERQSVTRMDLVLNWTATLPKN